MEEIKKEIKICIETNENENMTTQNPMGFSKSSAKGEGSQHYKLTSRNKRKNQINNLTLYLKQLEKEEMNSRVRRRKEIIKIGTEINEKEAKETIAKINKT